MPYILHFHVASSEPRMGLISDVLARCHKVKVFQVKAILRLIRLDNISDLYVKILYIIFIALEKIM